MAKIILVLIAVIYALNALLMWFAPQYWYETTPGVSMMGPFNLHFIRDVALTYLMASGAFIWAVRRDIRIVGLVGAAWPCMHALFHIQIWIARGLPLDDITATNLIAIQLPAWGALYLVTKLKRSPTL